MYGDPLEHPQTESYWGNVNPIGERSCYDEGKRAAECLTFDYLREHNLEVGCKACTRAAAHVMTPCAPGLASSLTAGLQPAQLSQAVAEA